MSFIKSYKRHILLVYLFLTSISIILVFVELNVFTKEHPLDGLFLNLSTEIAGVVIIFFILSYFLRDKEEELTAQITNLRQEIRSNVIFWDSREKDRELFKVKSYLSEAQSLLMVGSNMVNLIDHLREELPNAVVNGLNAKILILNPDHNNEAFKLIISTQENSEPLTKTTERSHRYISEIREKIGRSNRKVKGTLEVKTLTWVPSCSMTIILGKDNWGKAKITFNTPSQHAPNKDDRRRLTLILDKKLHEDEFDYFTRHFNLLWNPMIECKQIAVSNQ